MNGFTRIAACVPSLRPGDPSFNAARILELYRRAEAGGAAIALFPELSVTGYSCGDLFENRALVAAAEREILALARATEGRRALLVCGFPLRAGPRLFNAAAVLGTGRVLGVPIKEYLPNYREFYEKRQFRSVREFQGGTARIGSEEAPAGAGLVFECGSGAGAVRFGVEICEDLWSPAPPSTALALGGAQIVLNLSAGDELVAKADYRRSLVAGQSARLCCAYALAGAGVGESTADVVFSGHALVAFNGAVVAENERFSRDGSVAAADVNASWCDSLRASWSSFDDAPVPPGIRAVRVPELPGSPDLSLAAVGPR
ncbi:MAG: NAD(+) synthase, partial [Kiritimatiellae bacterium]|nr:NAD(+) synthase [Kiritimatiellia bacterium]